MDVDKKLLMLAKYGCQETLDIINNSKNRIVYSRKRWQWFILPYPVPEHQTLWVVHEYDFGIVNVGREYT